MIRRAILALCLLAGSATAQEITPGAVVVNGANRIGVTSATVSPGLLTLAGKSVTVSVSPAVCKAQDAVLVAPSSSLSLGTGIGSANMAGDGSVTINFVTSLAIGVTISSFTVQIICIGV